MSHHLVDKPKALRATQKAPLQPPQSSQENHRDMTTDQSKEGLGTLPQLRIGGISSSSPSMVGLIVTGHT